MMRRREASFKEAFVALGVTKDFFERFTGVML
jgi:hypothetical protein